MASFSNCILCSSIFSFYVGHFNVSDSGFCIKSFFEVIKHVLEVKLIKHSLVLEGCMPVAIFRFVNDISK